MMVATENELQVRLLAPAAGTQSLKEVLVLAEATWEPFSASRRQTLARWRSG